MSLYLETSALVKLYAHEPDSSVVRRHVGRASHVAISRVGYPAARAAFARRAREGRMRPAQLQRVVDRFDDDWKHLVVVELDAPLSRAAGDLAARHALRGFDAIHLASALRLGIELGTAPSSLAFDGALCAAAALEGLAAP